MANSLNVSVLVAAKEEYTNQLKYYLTPLIQEGCTSIYEDAVINDEENNPLRQFQIFLKQIPKWNQSILEEETKRIKDKCPFLMDLVTAIFVSHVKILASVRLGGNHTNIKIKIPTSEIFIHSVYVNVAERVYYEPQPFEDIHSRKNMEKIRETIDEMIDETISAMIPIQSILQEYLCSAFSDHTKLPPAPDPLPEPPSDREFNGMDLVDSEAPMDDFNSIKSVSINDDKLAKMRNEAPLFPIGDKPIFEDKIPPPSNDLPQDLGETLEATSVGKNDQLTAEDTAIGKAFSDSGAEEEKSFNFDDIPKEPEKDPFESKDENLFGVSTDKPEETKSHDDLFGSENKSDDIFGTGDLFKDDPFKSENPAETLAPAEKEFNFFDSNDNLF